MPLSKVRRAELEAELLKTMDKLDQLRLDELQARREHREQLALHGKKLKELRDILSGREGEQTSIPGTETGAVKPRKAAPLKKSEAKAMRAADDEFVAPVRRPTSEITRWAADARARKVPAFVVEMTGIRTKAEVVAKYGDMQAFEKGKPCPKPLADATARTRALRKGLADKSPPKSAPAFKDVRWVTEEDGRVLGIASDGIIYIIEETKQPFHGFRWRQGTHRASGPFPTIAEAQADGVDCDRIRQGQPKLIRETPKAPERG
jgi:hypothetical protein